MSINSQQEYRDRDEYKFFMEDLQKQVTEAHTKFRNGERLIENDPHTCLELMEHVHGVLEYFKKAGSI